MQRQYISEANQKKCPNRVCCVATKYKNAIKQLEKLKYALLYPIFIPLYNMKKLTIVYNNADYLILYEFEEYINRIMEINGMRVNIIQTHYKVIFDDERMKEQFGNPFEFLTFNYPNFFIRAFNDSVSSQNIVNTILLGIHELSKNNIAN